MAESPIIEADRLQVVPFRREHLTATYVSWLNDPVVVRYSDQRHHVHTLETCKDYMESYEGTPNYFWAIVVRDPELGHIGNINAYVDPIHSVADVGMMIGERRCWGRGYGSEAFVAVCNYLKRVAGIRKVTAGAMSVNTPMLRVMEHAGMVLDGTRRRHCVFEDREVDLIHMALFADNSAIEDR